MRFKLINDILPMVSEDNTGISILIDTGSKISVYTASIDSFLKRFPDSVNTQLKRPIGGFGVGTKMCPIYTVPEMSICGIKVINLPVAISENDDIASDLVLAGHVFTDNVFTLYYRDKEIEFQKLTDIRCKYTVHKEHNDVVDSFIVF